MLLNSFCPPKLVFTEYRSSVRIPDHGASPFPVLCPDLLSLTELRGDEVVSGAWVQQRNASYCLGEDPEVTD